MAYRTLTDGAPEATILAKGFRRSQPYFPTPSFDQQTLRHIDRIHDAKPTAWGISTAVVSKPIKNP